jgi:hypothetical protein
MTIEDIVARCSTFSGYKLQYELKPDSLRIWDPKAVGRSQLVVVLGSGGFGLHETYGRLRHWAITRQEQDVMIAALTPAGRPSMADPFSVEC